ncbi:MAG: Gfo/Idh/MocA family oxidoreductase [Treponema sp.]|jgi:predicted dehydrogenase|nr:Gfo/Idh/MocA family oxidoreductase [Treponema sp.]
MPIKPVKVGIIGAGMISYTYLENLINTFGITEVAGIADAIEKNARIRAEQFNIPFMTKEAIYADPDIEIVANLTNPASHFQISTEALEAGKHVYSEKIMGVNYQEAKGIYDLAIEKKLRFAQAPDTFLGGALQSARKLLDCGYIGEPVMAQAFCARGYRITGAEDVPLRFSYGPGGSMPYDMGPYYIHALVSLLGPVKRASGFARVFAEKKAYENPRHRKYKTTVDLSEPSVMLGVLEFHNRCIANISTAGDCHLPEVPRLEIYGTQGTIICPDPNHFGGDVFLCRAPDGNPWKIPLTHGFTAPNREKGIVSGNNDAEAVRWSKSCRGIGIADLAWGIRNNRPHRCSAELGLHTVEIIRGIIQSGRDGQACILNSKPERPAALPAGFVSGGSVDEACLDN